MANTQTDVATRSGNGSEVPATMRGTYDELLKFVDEIPALDPEFVQLEIVKQIMAADTLDEAMATIEATPAKEMDGRKITIRGVAWMPSAFAEGPSRYALLDTVDPATGEARVVSMGGASAMAVLRWAELHEAMPFDVVFRLKESRSNPERRIWTMVKA